MGECVSNIKADEVDNDNEVEDEPATTRVCANRNRNTSMGTPTEHAT